MGKLNGDEIVLELNTGTTISPVWSLVVCITEQDLDLQAEEIDANSKCGTDTLVGQITTTANFTGFFDDEPDAGAVSMNELFEIIQAKELKEWRMLNSEGDGDKYYRGFTGRLSAFNESANTGEAVTFTATISVSGAVDTTAPTT